MKIAIIGGGWLGCHLSKKLKDDHDVTLVDKATNLFTESSFKNQNRLHLGYHYPRSNNTRQLCTSTFDKFTREYDFAIRHVDNNLYAIPLYESVLDYASYINQFNHLNHDELNELGVLDNIEGLINAYESRIDHEALHFYFNDIHSDIFTQRHIRDKDLRSLSKDFDLVLDCTNNSFMKYSGEYIFELCLTHLYKVIKKPPFGALTLVDGPFFSIFPYDDNMFTITDVEYTPVLKTKSMKDIYDRQDNITHDEVLKISNLIENKITKYFNSFHDYFVHSDYFLSIKSKTITGHADRTPVIQSDGNVVTCFTGKIQGIFLVANEIKKMVNSK